MYFHESVYGAVPSENWLRHLRAPGFGGLAEPVVLPRVTGDVFRNTGASSSDNCCALCPITLGVGVNGTGANGMEIVYTVSGHRAGFEYDILRTQRHSIWERVAGAWSRLGGQPMGTGDDQSSRDECLRPVGNRIFVVDRPGFNRPFPAADGLIIQGPAGRASTATATDIVLRASFAEWVITRNKALGVDWK